MTSSLKTGIALRLLIAASAGVGLSPALLAQSDPRIDSWFTRNSGRYARIVVTDADRAAGITKTTWDGALTGQTGVQSLPTYSGIHQVSSSANWVYIRSTGLGGHVMGPWYLNASRSTLFPNLPRNTAALFRFPRHPTVPATKALTGGGAIGYFVDGVAMFDSRDAFSYTSGSGSPGTEAGMGGGSGYWNRDAYVNEGLTFDPALAHQPGSGQYHYHANPPALRHLLNDRVLFNPATKTYSEDIAGTNLSHSPILGWVRDGFPVYGPYGYSNPTNPASGVRRMISGYRQRDPSAPGATSRTTYPRWAMRATGLASTNLTTHAGPAVSAQRPLGRYMEDNDYLGDLGFTLGVEFDLNEQNVRWCVTPEYPSGTWAYFVCIAANGAPVFPYNIGRQYFGTATGPTAGGAVASITETVVTNFNGGPNMPLKADAVTVNAANGDVTLVWSATEGGRYQIESAAELNSWRPLTAVTATNNTVTVADPARANSDPRQFYRGSRTSLAPFDDTGFSYNPQSNILLIIVDDWGVDASPLDNTTPDAVLPKMPNLANLASQGLRFTRAWAQPTCSPTRASIMTGRQVYQHNVGYPTEANQFNPTGAETTLPEVFANAGSPYARALIGKWHLGGNNSGYSSRGNWPEFYGFNSGAVASYYNWTKNSNGVSSTSSTYALIDQVNEALAFIGRSQAAARPWFCWLALNSAHDPFEEPPAALAPPGGYSNPATANASFNTFIRMLEALDTELGRLLAGIPPNTDIILIGDNGTPGANVQAPYGPPGMGAGTHAKGDLYNGGIHVPLIVKGPAVASSLVGATTAKLVQCADLFSTVLDLAGIDPLAFVPASQNVRSASLVPILKGTDTANRFQVAERNLPSGRALRVDSFPDYKLIINGDPTSTSDVPTFEFYNVATDVNEQSPLNIATLTGTALAAYNACRAKDAELGGGYSDAP